MIQAGANKIIRSAIAVLTCVFIFSSISTNAEEILDQPADTVNTFPLNIYRSEAFINRALIPTVYVDGLKIGTLQDGEALIVKVTEGSHKIELKGEFPEWVKEFNKELDVSVTPTAPSFVKLDAVYTGIVTPTTAETDFEFIEIDAEMANREISMLKIKMIDSGSNAEINKAVENKLVALELH